LGDAQVVVAWKRGAILTDVLHELKESICTA
jgi:hypothetical protein